MVFGFFKKRNISPERVPLPASPGLEPQSPDIDIPEATTSDVQQLRTPSPSIEESAAPTTSSVPFLSNLFGFGSRQEIEITQPAPDQDAEANPISIVEGLTAHLSAIPPKTLHSYILSRLPNTPEETLSHLLTFFSEVTPPPRLHCVRCHQDYAEVENTDRSCLVAHDDESALVERVGTATKRGKAVVGATFETLWQCCGKTVEGDGDQGPPDGWCYEGMHTTDVKRARFRADSTPQHDKLTSCLKLNCHGIRDQLPRKLTRGRKRVRSEIFKELDTDSAMDVDEESTSAKTPRSVRSSRRAARSPPATKPTSVAGKKKEQLAKSKGTDDEGSVKSAPTGKRRGRPPKNRAAETASDIGDEKDLKGGHKTRSVSRTRLSRRGTATTDEPTSTTKRRKVE